MFILTSNKTKDSHRVGIYYMKNIIEYNNVRFIFFNYVNSVL